LICQWEGCNQQISDSQQLLHHLERNHVEIGKTIYPCLWRGCQFYGHSFRKLTRIISHLRTHTGEQLFRCHQPHCGRWHSILDPLKDQCQLQPDKKKMACSYGCGKMYYYEKSKKKHEREAHGANKSDSFTGELLTPRCDNTDEKLKDAFHCDDESVSKSSAYEKNETAVVVVVKLKETASANEEDS